MARDEDSDALISISPRDLTKVALQLEREADEKAEHRRFPRAQTEPSNPSEDERRLRWCEHRLLVLSGEDGTNGKIGNTRRDVDGIRAFLKYVATGLVGSLLTAGGAIYMAGQKDGAKDRDTEYLRAEVASLKAEVRELRAQPAYRPPVWPRGVDQ